jgi:ubiquinone/menaquinone biosynthesis C-methylase UbiE
MSKQEGLFTEAARYYDKYRPRYPEVFFHKVGEEFKLDGTGRLLDLGCGTGQLAIPLAASFQEVIGVDPEDKMLLEAKQQALSKGITNITWLRKRAEDLNPMAGELGSFKLVTIGNAFHWMDQERVLFNLDQLVDPDGGIVIVKNPVYKPSDWRVIMQDVVIKYLGEEGRGVEGRYIDANQSFRSALLGSSFKDIERYSFPFQYTWGIESIIGYLYSTSFCPPRLLGENRGSFERDLGGSLLDLNPNATFTENNEAVALFARRAGEAHTEL